MQLKECIILAGGLGTRLRSEVADLPKCMAPVAGKPFLHYVLKYLSAQNISRFIFSVGYMHEAIENYIKANHADKEVIFSLEEEPFGTGGAIKLALQQCNEENVLIVNGDTLFEADTNKLLWHHIELNAHCTLALKPMQYFDRYGVVWLDKKNMITGFSEKQQTAKGLINGGVYILQKSAFQQLNLPQKFPFEKDYLEKYTGAEKMIGVPDEGYFIDIGIPEDFHKANTEFKNK